MNVKIEFDVTLWAPDDYPNSAALTFPYNALEVFSTKGRIPVKFSVDGHEFRSTLAPMGGQHMMVFNLEMRNKTGYKAGDTVHIILERDTEERKVEIPEDVLLALKEDLSDENVFTRQSYSHQKEHVNWINDAKKPETRQRRIAKLIESLKANQKK